MGISRVANCTGPGSTCVYSANKKRISQAMSRLNETNTREKEAVVKCAPPSFLEAGFRLDDVDITSVMVSVT